LFFSPKFSVHRLVGLAYILLWIAAYYYYLTDYDYLLKKSWLLILLPLSGVTQSFSARYYFTFLPKNKKDPGYYGDKGAMSYPFVKENGYYALLCLFQFLYYLPYLTPWFKKFYVIEAVWVFLPYFVIRPLFPKTSFRDGLNNDKGKTSELMITFYFFATWMTKIFYVWAKHFIGLYINYLMFMGVVDDYLRMYVYGNLIWGSFATTFAMFLHTLKFKGYLPGWLSFTLYIISYLQTFYTYGMISYVFFEHRMLSLITLVGVFVNVYNFRLHDLYQVVLCGAAYAGYLKQL